MTILKKNINKIITIISTPKINSKWISIFSLFVLGISLIPLFLIAKFNMPQADDYMYGVYNYSLYQSGAGFFEILECTISTLKSFYMNWTGLYAALFVWLLNPTVFGLNFITPYLMIGGLIVSTYLFLHVIFIDILKSKISHFL
ncbi:MAG: hypothetical protein RR933_03070, partial [Oscillospiraceae bacterium]